MQRFVEMEGLEVSTTEIQSELDRMESMLADMPANQRPDTESLRRTTGNRILTGRAIEQLMAITSGEPGDLSDDDESKIETEPTD